MKIFKLSILLMLVVMVMAGTVSATPARITSITDRINGPFRVAVDASGNLYVTERSKGLVLIYSSEGKYVKQFSVADPKGIAVDSAGMIYIGSSNSVNMYTPDLDFVRSLDNGDIVVPNDIAVGSDGKVFVVSKGNYSTLGLVKAYDPVAGSSFIFSGSFTQPNAIAVSDTAGAGGEIYVLDRPVVAAVVKNRIQVFSKSGQYLREFEFMAGQTTMKPQGIAVDSAGLLYVVDSTTNGVFVLNPADGSPAAGTAFFFDPKIIMRTPLGIAVSKNGLVYVASSKSDDNMGNGRIDVFALDGYVTMAVDPLSLTFDGKQYAGNPDPQTINISNTSGTNGGTLNWSAAADQTWIKLDASQGSVGPSSAVGLPVHVDISSFGAGTYTGTITIDSGFGQKRTVSVTVSVVPANVLNISNGWLNFIAKMGTTPAAQGITIGVDNLTGSLSWSMVSDSPSWLTASPVAGTLSAAAPSSPAVVSVNTTSLAVGTYSGVLTVSVPGAIGTPGKINVSLMVTSSTKITVNSNRPDAKFSLSGPVSDAGSGLTWTTENVPAGQYTVTFDAVSGFRKPLPQTKTLMENGEISFSGTYVSWKELAAKKNMVVAKGPDMRNDAQIKVYKGNGAPVAFDLVALATRYGANVAVGDVDGVGDGTAEIIVGSGDGPNNAAIVRIFRADKTLLAEFVPFATMNGVRVVAADLNGDGKAEVLVSPAGGVENTGKVAAYGYDTLQKKMIATGIEFTAYTYAYGANIAVADLDGDGNPVIVTAPGSGSQNPALIKIWKIDTTANVGSWTVSASPVKEISLPGTEGAAIAAGDLNGDGRSEIIAGTSGEHAMVTIIKADGSQARFRVPGHHRVNVAAADLDGDGNAEIITATGPESSEQETTDDAKGTYSDKLNDRKKDGKEKEAEYGRADHERGAVRVFNASGALLYTVVPFEEAKDGINIAVGDLGL